MITSEDNKVFKKLKSLLKPKGRKEFNEFIAEGEKFLNFKPKAIFYSEDYLGDSTSGLVLSSKLFKLITTQENSQGVICVFNVMELKELNSKEIILLEKIRDPGNLGTILRTCEFFGFKDIALMNCVDVFNPKVVRSSMGSIFNLNLVNISLDRLSNMKKEDYEIIVTLPNENNDLKNLKTKNKFILVIGNESFGISNDIINLSNSSLSIPSYGSTESLNVSSAAAIIIYSLRCKNEC